VEEMMLLKQLFDQDTWTYTYLLADVDRREAIIIDPVIERIDRDLMLIDELGLKLNYTLDTHVHADHVTGSGEIRRRTGAQSAVSAVSQVDCADLKLMHGDMLPFGRYTLKVRSTPGHTNGCLTFVVESDGQTMAFTGDALLIRGCGRTDFQQGDAATLYRSVHEQIYSLPANTVIYPGHDYRGHSSSTVAEEQAHNRRLKTSIDQSTFAAIMNDLDLAYPKRIHEALPANMACGLLEPSSEVMLDPASREVDVQSVDFSGVTRVVDVRNRQEFEGEPGHLPGAILAPLSELAEQANSWRREDPILVVCHSGKRSAQGCAVLSEMGFLNVTHLSGGMSAWHAHMEKSV